MQQCPGMFWTAEGCVTLAGAFRVQFDPLVGQLNESNPCFPSESIRLVPAFFPPGLFGALWRRGRLNLCKRSQRAVSGSTEPLTEATDLRSDPRTCSSAGTMGETSSAEI